MKPTPKLNEKTIALAKHTTVKRFFKNPELAASELCKRSFFYFVREFWDQISSDTPVWNWHIPVLCAELSNIVSRVSSGLPNAYDLLVNIPPGTTKSLLFSVFFPAWTWVNYPHLKFIKTSYSASLSLEHAEMCRNVVRSRKYQALFPRLKIKRDSDMKSNFRILFEKDGNWNIGGNLYSTSVGGTVTGYHSHISIIDDPIDPFRAHSEVEIASSNRFISQVLPTRKVDKKVSSTIMIMQRVMQGDPSDEWLKLREKGLKIKHICLPGVIDTESDKQRVSPQEYLKYYHDKYLDHIRLSQSTLDNLKLQLGQYGFASQIQQDSTPSMIGSMFNVSRFKIVEYKDLNIDALLIKAVRYWDKAGSEGTGAYTARVKIASLKNGMYLVMYVVRGQWETNKRERIILETAISDGPNTLQKQEQEPGSGGKDQAQATKISLQQHGIPIHTERPTGDKVYRADPWSVRVNEGKVLLVKADWNMEYIEEHRRFSKMAKYKDQVDASSGAYSELFIANRATAWGR